MISFDEFPVVYFALGHLLAAGLIVLLLQKWFKISALFFVLLALLLVAFMRFPVVLFNQELNPDESQMLSHAITLRYFPIYWDSVDGTTIGPLDHYVLLFATWLNRPLDFISARFVGLLCVLGSLYFFYRSLRHFFNENTARLGLLPPLFLLTFTQDVDLVHYSSEQLPLFLLNVGLWLLGRLYAGKHDGWSTFGLGAVLSLSLFAKIQALPQAAVLGVFGLFWLVQRVQADQTWKADDGKGSTLQTWKVSKTFQVFARRSWLLMAGGISVLIAVALWAWGYGVLDDFWNFYVLGNAIYAGGSSLIDSVLRTPSFVAKTPDFLWFLVVIFTCAGMSVLNKFRRLDALFYLVMVWLLAAWYAATKSGNDFGHYLNLCIYPAAFFGGFCISTFEKNKRLAFVIAVSALLPSLLHFVFQLVKRQPVNRYVSTSDHRLQPSEVSKVILENAQPGDRLAVWGWMCRYYVETQLPQGAAENHTERCIFTHPMQPIYYQRYLDDLSRNRPAFFVDAVGPNSLWVRDRATQGHDAFPELNVFIAKNYQLLTEVDSTRIYQLRR